MTDGINLVMGDDGVFREMPEPYKTLNIATEADWNALLATVHRGNRMRWISVGDRLPDRDIEVLVCARRKGDGIIRNHVIAITSYTDNMFGYNISGWVAPWAFFFEEYEIVYWMPLPEIPEEDDE